MKARTKKLSRQEVAQPRGGLKTKTQVKAGKFEGGDIEADITQIPIAHNY